MNRWTRRARMALVFTLSFIAGAVLAPANAGAAEGHADAVNSRRDAVLLRLKPGDLARIKTTTEAELRGVVVESGRFGLVLENTSPDEVSAGTIDGIWTRGSLAGEGAVLMGGLGLLAGYVYGAYNEWGAPPGEEDATALRVVGHIVTGGVVGGVLGYFLGSKLGTWDRRFP